LVYIFYGLLEYFTVIWYIIWQFGNLVHSPPPFWYSLTGKIWQPWPKEPADEQFFN
jgi:hypothetical protein